MSRDPFSPVCRSSEGDPYAPLELPAFSGWGGKLHSSEKQGEMSLTRLFWEGGEEEPHRVSDRHHALLRWLVAHQQRIADRVLEWMCRDYEAAEIGQEGDDLRPLAPTADELSDRARLASVDLLADDELEEIVLWFDTTWDPEGEWSYSIDDRREDGGFVLGRYSVP